MKKWIIPFLALAALVFSSCGSGRTSVKRDTQKPGAKREAVGSARDTAVLLSPGSGVRQSGKFTLTDARREYWFRIPVKKGVYTFESVGAASKGFPSANLLDPNLWSVASSQARPNRNFILTYTESGDRTVYLKVVLASGAQWTGTIKYQMERVKEPAPEKDRKGGKKK